MSNIKEIVRKLASDFVMTAEQARIEQNSDESIIRSIMSLIGMEISLTASYHRNDVDFRFGYDEKYIPPVMDALKDLGYDVTKVDPRQDDYQHVLKIRW